MLHSRELRRDEGNERKWRMKEGQQGMEEAVSSKNNQWWEGQGWGRGHLPATKPNAWKFPQVSSQYPPVCRISHSWSNLPT